MPNNRPTAMNARDYAEDAPFNDYGRGEDGMLMPTWTTENAVREPQTPYQRYENRSLGDLVQLCVDKDREIEELRDKYYKIDNELHASLVLLRGRL